MLNKSIIQPYWVGITTSSLILKSSNKNKELLPFVFPQLKNACSYWNQVLHVCNFISFFFTNNILLRANFILSRRLTVKTISFSNTSNCSLLTLLESVFAIIWTFLKLCSISQGSSAKVKKYNDVIINIFKWQGCPTFPQLSSHVKYVGPTTL